MHVENEFMFRSTCSPSKCFNVFADFKTQKKFCDITFTVGKQNIAAHRIVMAAAIPYFQEKLNTETDEIMMPDVDPCVFESLIDFVYSCELKITMENVKDLLRLASQFRMDEVLESCCDFVAERLRPENTMNFRELAVELNYSQLTEIIDHYINERFTDVFETENFLSCPFAYMMEIIGKGNLQVDNEEKVIEAVLKWVKASPDDRKVHLPDLLRLVRMPLMTPLYLTDILEREELMRSSMETRDLIEEARNYNLFPQRRKGTCSFLTYPRHFQETGTASIRKINEECIYGLCIEVRYTINCLDFTGDNTWTEFSDISYTEDAGCGTQLNQKMYFFHDGYTWQYSPNEDEDKYLAYLTVPRVCCGAASLKNRIFVCGGRIGSTEFSNVVECFDPNTDQWTIISHMRKARSLPCAVTLGECIYVLGGRDNTCVHDSVERYPSVTGKWQTIAPMRSKRCAAGAAALNGIIYVCGGQTNLDGECTATAEVYDPVKNKWEFISPMNTERKQFTLVSCRGKLYALGGVDADSENLCTSEVYDPEIDEWTFGPQINPKNCVSGAVVI